jgi:hypothetical protein
MKAIHDTDPMTSALFSGVSQAVRLLSEPGLSGRISHAGPLTRITASKPPPLQERQHQQAAGRGSTEEPR